MTVSTRKSAGCVGCHQGTLSWAGQPTGVRRPPAFVETLLLDGALGKGFCLESIVRNPRPALNGSAIRATRDALLGPADGGEVLVQLGHEGDCDRLRFERRARVFVLAGLLALKGSVGTDLAVQLNEHGRDARPFLGDKFTCPSLIHDNLRR